MKETISRWRHDDGRASAAHSKVADSIKREGSIPLVFPAHVMPSALETETHGSPIKEKFVQAVKKIESISAHEMAAPTEYDGSDGALHNATQNSRITSGSELDAIKTSAPNEGDPSRLLGRGTPKAEGNDPDDHPAPQTEPRHNPSRANPGLLFQALSRADDPNPGASDQSTSRPASTLAQCDDPFLLTVDGKDVAIDTQIQLYATNGQLCHPWVSPVLGYLGGLPPLFVCCGDSEVLRDEIIYL